MATTSIPSSVDRGVAGVQMIPVCSGKYRVWTKRVGSGNLKVLLLHGGPGFNHDYFECFELFLPQEGIEIYYYDQLGCGHSDRPRDASLWETARYLEEVEEVRVGLGLTDFVMLGHSWGGILTMEYAYKHQSQGHLRGIVISNMVASIDSFLAYAVRWKDKLSEEQRQIIDQVEAEGDWDNPDYEKIMMEVLYPQMMCRVVPWPEPVSRSFQIANTDIYHHMQGHSEFVVTGNLKGWTMWDRLPSITVKTLVLGGDNDEMGPDDCRKMAEIMPNAEVAICPDGSHMAFWDDQERYFGYLIRFLKSLL